MDDLDDLITGPNKGLYRLHFGKTIEAEYRKAARRQRKYPRVLLFLILGASFALAPYYESSLFGVPIELKHFLRIIEFAVVVPATFIAAAATYFEFRASVTSAAQTAATACLWSTTLLLRSFALQEKTHYPSSMIGIVVIAIAIFGGFNWYRVAFGAGIVLLCAAVQEFELNKIAGDAWLQINALFLMSLIAILGAYVNEVGHRLAWVNGRSASLLARTDVLTGLANRAEFNRIFPRVFRQARRERCAIAVALVDIDRFKRINDQHGHLCGDEVLKAVGKSLLYGTAKRPLDIMVRFGGEEMVVVWYDVSQDALPLLVEALLSEIRGIRVEAPNGSVLNITASVGVVWLMPDASSVPEEVLRHADGLMYRAKAEGRDRAVVGSSTSGRIQLSYLPEARR